MARTWPNDVFDFVFFPNVKDILQSLSDLAEEEAWEYIHSSSEREQPILFNYIRYTYRRLAEEDKVEVADDGTSVTFNTGLVTSNKEPIFCYATHNHMEDIDVPWHFQGWLRKGENKLSGFSTLPTMAHYYEDPSSLVLDTRKDLRVNVEHIIEHNKERFPEPYDEMTGFQLQTFLKGAINNARERAKRNYKTAVPQYYRGHIQLLLPLCMGSPDVADLALVVDDRGSFYRASTCLTLDMAYNNARQLARPNREWLKP